VYASVDEEANGGAVVVSTPHHGQFTGRQAADGEADDAFSLVDLGVPG
jgi:hypothetical protein